MLEDEAQLLQFGFADVTEFIDYKISVPFGSSWINFPTAEKPSDKFKYISVEFNMSADHNVINRQTYSILDWMGDMGGLVDAFFILGQLLISPVSSFALHSKLLSSMFRYRDSYRSDNRESQRDSFFGEYFQPGDDN